MSKHEEIGHAIPKPTIIGSYFALLLLTAVMLGLSRINVERLGIEWIDLHAVKTSIIMGVALVMGLIVSMFLMGLRYESKLLNLTIFLSNFVFLLIFVLFTWVDTSFRGAVDPTFTEKINFVSPVKTEASGHGAGHQAAPAGSQGTQPPATPQSGTADPDKNPASGTDSASRTPASRQEAAPPAAKETAPADKEAAPANKEAAPAKKEAAPAH